MKSIPLEAIEKSIFEFRGRGVIIDSDVARLYGVEAKRVNEAVRNNPGKFPEGYVLELTADEWDLLKTKFSTSIKGGKVKLPRVFTEKGLYMLATILKSKIASDTTIAIIETFAKMRELSSAINKIGIEKDYDVKEGLVKKSGEIMQQIISEDMKVVNTETSVEFNFAIVKFKHSVKRGKE